MTPSDRPLSNTNVRFAALRRANASEAGSAYLATLLVLVVLTILGLSLAVITQTEVLIGGSEKQATRQLFDAGSGVELAAAYELVKRDSASTTSGSPPRRGHSRPGHGDRRRDLHDGLTSRSTPASATSAR